LIAIRTASTETRPRADGCVGRRERRQRRAGAGM